MSRGSKRRAQAEAQTEHAKMASLPNRQPEGENYLGGEKEGAPSTPIFSVELNTPVPILSDTPVDKPLNFFNKFSGLGMLGWVVAWALVGAAMALGYLVVRYLM